MLGPNAVHAQDATWTGSADSNWNNDLNWSPAAPAGTATFSAAADDVAHIFLTFTAIDTLQFTTTAPAYSYNLFGQALVIGGAGVLNSSSNAPTFNAFGLLEFDNAATAGNAIINNAGATTFTGTSTAGNARIANSSGGRLSFTDSSTAGNATILTLSLAKTQFASNSTAQRAIDRRRRHLRFFPQLRSGRRQQAQRRLDRRHRRLLSRRQPAHGRRQQPEHDSQRRHQRLWLGRLRMQQPRRSRRRTGEGRHRHDDPGR